MAARKRDYKKEYAQRVARAKREGFSGYAQKRRVRREAVNRVMSVLPKHAKRKTVAHNVGRMDMDELSDMMEMSLLELQTLAKTDAKYHYK